jgi:hypothetical protein
VVGLIRVVIGTSPLRSPKLQLHFYICRFFAGFRIEFVWLD